MVVSFFQAGIAASQWSNMAILDLLKGMGRTDITVHGFRSPFKRCAMRRRAFLIKLTCL